MHAVVCKISRGDLREARRHFTYFVTSGPLATSRRPHSERGVGAPEAVPPSAIVAAAPKPATPGEDFFG